MEYDQFVRKQIEEWEHQLFKAPGFFERTSNRVSAKLNGVIPSKFQKVITTTVKGIVRASLFSAQYLPNGKPRTELNLHEADQLAKEYISKYQKAAVAEGAGTGAAGIALSAVDFPALIAIKMKLLFELAHVYGFTTEVFSEKIYLIKLFQLTFSSPEQQRKLYKELRNWNETHKQWSSDQQFYRSFDWEQFQKEYRDSLDFRKLLQMIPGIGALAGAWANHGILEELGAAAMNMYRIRRLNENLMIVGDKT